MPYTTEKKMLRVELADLEQFQHWQNHVNDSLVNPLSQAEFFSLLVEHFKPLIDKWVGLK